MLEGGNKPEVHQQVNDSKMWSMHTMKYYDSVLNSYTWYSMCACLLSHFRHVQLFVTPWTVGHQAPLSMGFSRQEYWSGLPGPLPGDLSDLGIESLMSPLAGGFLATRATWETQINELKDISWVEFSHSVMSDSFWPHGLQHARRPCLLPIPRTCSNTCPSSWWCQPSHPLLSPSPPAFNLS